MKIIVDIKYRKSKKRKTLHHATKESDHSFNENKFKHGILKCHRSQNEIIQSFL